MNSDQTDQVVIDPSRVFRKIEKITDNIKSENPDAVVGVGVLFRADEDPWTYRQAIAIPRADYSRELPDLKFPRKGSPEDVAVRIESFLRDHRVTLNARNALHALRSFLLEGKVIAGSTTLVGNECARMGLL